MYVHQNLLTVYVNNVEKHVIFVKDVRKNAMSNIRKYALYTPKCLFFPFLIFMDIYFLLVHYKYLIISFLKPAKLMLMSDA